MVLSQKLYHGASFPVWKPMQRRQATRVVFLTLGIIKILEHAVPTACFTQSVLEKKTSAAAELLVFTKLNK